MSDARGRKLSLPHSPSQRTAPRHPLHLRFVQRPPSDLCGTKHLRMLIRPLPLEVLGQIFSNLDRLHDARTLCSSAQVSRRWCSESQRVLFCTAFLESWDVSKYDNEENLLRQHRQFLEAILGAKDRLGPLVRSYSQYLISCDEYTACESYSVFAYPTSKAEFILM